MWIIFALGASVFWGLTYVFNEQVYKKISVLSSLAVASFFIFIITGIIAYFSGNLKSDLYQISQSKQLLWYVIGGIVVLLVAEVFIGFSITAKSATLAGLIEISYPVFIALFSYLLYKNHVSTSTIIGGIIIFTGIFVIYYFNQ